MKRVTAGISLVFLSTLSAAAAGLEILAPHRAVYDVKLIDAQERSGIANMDGRIVYELTGSACDGISIQYRFVTRINTGRETFVTDQQSASYESPDGNEFSFSTRSFVNEQPDQNITGAATLIGDSIKVTHSGSDPRELELEKGLFTSRHLLAVLNSADAGEVFVSHRVFDGSGDGDQVLKSATVIGKEKQVEDRFEGEGEAAAEELDSKSAFPVTMSYFNPESDNTSEGVPIYEASFLLYRNGITRDLSMRYPDYELKATLSELELLDSESCD
ncbi:MAG: DUF1849 family protein [Pseudomonadota bacterium]